MQQLTTAVKLVAEFVSRLFRAEFTCAELQSNLLSELTLPYLRLCQSLLTEFADADIPELVAVFTSLDSLPEQLHRLPRNARCDVSAALVELATLRVENHEEHSVGALIGMATVLQITADSFEIKVSDAPIAEDCLNDLHTVPLGVWRSFGALNERILDAQSLSVLIYALDQLLHSKLMPQLRQIGDSTMINSLLNAVESACLAAIRFQASKSLEPIAGRWIDLFHPQPSDEESPTEVKWMQAMDALMEMLG